MDKKKMTNPQPSQELKPCPFCGRIPLVHDGIHVRCDASGCEMSVHPSVFVKDWNSAYCWKEITLLREQKKALIEELKKYHQEYVNHQDNKQTKGCTACEAIALAGEKP